MLFYTLKTLIPYEKALYPGLFHLQTNVYILFFLWYNLAKSLGKSVQLCEVRYGKKKRT